MLHHLRALRPPLGLSWRRLVSQNAHLTLSGEQPLKQVVLAHVQALVAQHDDASSRMLSEGYSAARSKELTRLTPIVEAHAELVAAQRDVDGTSELLSDPSSEPELIELAREELAEGERILVERRKQLISLLVPPDATSAQRWRGRAEELGGSELAAWEATRGEKLARELSELRGRGRGRGGRGRGDEEEDEGIEDMPEEMRTEGEL